MTGGTTRATEEGTWRDVARDIGRGMVEGVGVRMTRAGAGRGVANGLAVGGALEGAGWRKEVVVVLTEQSPPPRWSEARSSPHEPSEGRWRQKRTPLL